MHKYVYLFTEGNADMRNLLGGKGANLAEMTNIGLPVPQGFTITTEACTQYYEDGREINDDIQKQINEYIVKMEEITGKKFGDKENPLLVSVRSGARASMPGMMDTILNLGLNEEVVETLAEKSGNPVRRMRLFCCASQVKVFVSRFHIPWLFPFVTLAKSAYTLVACAACPTLSISTIRNNSFFKFRCTIFS